jgi:hypothetical protein
VLLAHRRQFETESVLQAVAIDDRLHRMVVVPLCGRTDSAASAMIETMESEWRMMIVVQGMSWLTMCRIGTVMFEGRSG